MSNNKLIGRDQMDREQEIAYAYGLENETIPIKLYNFADFDFIMIKDGKAVESLEVKERSNKINDFKETMVPLRKVVRALEIIRGGGVAKILIKWTDCTGILDFSVPFDKIGLGGRQDRGVDERKPYAFYSVLKFKRLE